MEIWPGEPFELGASFDGAGTNFALFSEVAERVELCLFDDGGAETRIDLPERTNHVWHGHLPGVGPGQRYGFRVHGPDAPDRGHRCNPAKLLLDPYARAINGRVTWNDAVYGGAEDSAPYVPRSVVVSPYFDWGDDRAPRTEWSDTVIYEVHVKGFTKRNPAIPEALRGTYAGLAHPAAIRHLTELGVTAVELMPVHHFVHDHFLDRRGLRNYWGYNSIGFFAPHAEYAARGDGGQQIQEFRQMVRTLHEAGIEVILDVVYNHTAETDHTGPTLCFRGIDNRAYYRIDPADPSRYVDYTGCGNSLYMRSPWVLKLILDSLRYWVEELHVDGFRFDLAAALARELHDVDRLATFFNLIHQDPVLSRVKLIAEPWDVGEGGYQVGNFPTLWSEWNGKYRDTVRDFLRGRDQTVPELAYRLTGSSDLYASSGRRPHASVNFVTCHDGFTLRDLVSYEHKHNEANGEDNRDGDDHNRSDNHGVEGPTDDPAIVAVRAQQQRNFLTILFVSQGVPMLLAGDELGRTQNGNNNAYCQDHELSWLDWEGGDRELHAFTRRLIALRADHPVFRRRRWFEGHSIRGNSLRDIGWFGTDGAEMTDDDWHSAQMKALGVFLNGDGIPSCDARGQPVVDDSFYVALNAHAGSRDFTLPESLGDGWRRELDTVRGFVESEPVVHGNAFSVAARSIQILRRPRGQ